MAIQWKQLTDYTDYEVSDAGQVRNIKSQKVLKIDMKHSGVVCCAHGKKKGSLSVAKLMRIYFPVVIDGEDWKTIPDYPAYEASTTGRIRNLDKMNVLNPFDHCGYLTVGLMRDGVNCQCRVHIMIASTFITKDEGRIWVNHKDGNKHNNKADNLEWVTPAENTQHAVATGLRSEYKRAVLQIDPDTDEVIARFESIQEAKEITGCGNVGGVCRGTHNLCGGFKWEFEDTSSRDTIDNTEAPEGEEWRDSSMPGYRVSSHGWVHSERTGRLMTLQKEPNGRTSVKLRAQDGLATCLVHRLVATAFHPNPDALPHVDHIDKDYTNNHYINLRWSTAQDNSRHSFARAVDQLHPDGSLFRAWTCIRDAAKAVGCSSAGSISACCGGSRTLCKGFRWCYHEKIEIAI